MAATRLIPLHIKKGQSLVRCLSDRIGYSQNPEKTEGGELVTAYACTPEFCEQEFLLTKSEYQKMHFAPPSGHRCVCQRPPSVASGRG